MRRTVPALVCLASAFHAHADETDYRLTTQIAASACTPDASGCEPFDIVNDSFVGEMVVPGFASPTQVTSGAGMRSQATLTVGAPTPSLLLINARTEGDANVTYAPGDIPTGASMFTEVVVAWRSDPIRFTTTGGARLGEPIEVTLWVRATGDVDVAIGAFSSHFATNAVSGWVPDALPLNLPQVGTSILNCEMGEQPPDCINAAAGVFTDQTPGDADVVFPVRFTVGDEPVVLQLTASAESFHFSDGAAEGWGTVMRTRLLAGGASRPSEEGGPFEAFFDLPTGVTANTSDGRIVNNKLVGGTPCPADLAEPSGVLNFFDLSEFLSRFNAQDPTVDFAEPFGTFNFFDLGAFLTLFNQGCP